MKNVLMSVTLASAVALLSQCASAEVTYHLEELDLSKMTKGSDQVRKNQSTGGNTLTMNKVQYSTGVGTHAESHYVIYLNGKGVSFSAKVGVDDESLDGEGRSMSNGVIFRVVSLDDGTDLANSGVVNAGEGAKEISASLEGVAKIDLVVETNGATDWDHADWVETELVCSEAIFADEETRRLWNPTGSGKSIADGAEWNPTFTTGYPTHCDFFAINSETPAALSVGESFAAKKLWVGYGVTLNDSGEFVQDPASDRGAVFNMTGGTLDVIDELRIGAACADNNNCIMNVTGGKVSAGKLIMGDCAPKGGKYNGLTIDGAEMELNFGESTLSPWNAGNSKIEIKNGGKLTSKSSFYVGASGSATVTVEGTDSSFISSGNLHIAQDPSATGVVHVVSGTLQAGNDIYVGNKGFGTLTIDGGTVSCTYWLDFNREEGSSSEHGGVVNFNGGVLNVGKIHSARGPSTFNWNGGTYKPNGNHTDGNQTDCFEASEGLTVNVLAGGAVLDTSSCSEKSRESIIAPALAGSGFFKKTGSGTGELKGSVNLRGGFIVEEGTLKITGTIAETTDTTPLQEISVADGASLDLNKQTVHVLAYKVAGVEKKAGTYPEQNGTIIVINARRGGLLVIVR